MDALLAYLTTACDPLTGLVRRVEVERAAAAALRDDPVRTCVWFAGMIGPFVRALPSGDPWSQVSVRLPNGLTAGPLPPASSGAVTAGRTFGTVEDHLDLVPRGADNIDDDVQLAGIADPLPLPSSFVIASAGAGGDVIEVAAACLAVHTLAESDGGFAIPPVWAAVVLGRDQVDSDGGFYVLSAALRMVLARYRTYVGDGAVSAEAPQLALELDAWLADHDLSGVDPSAEFTELVAQLEAAIGPVRPARPRVDLVWGDAVGLEVDPDALSDGEPPLRSEPIPPTAYRDFRLS